MDVGDLNGRNFRRHKTKGNHDGARAAPREPVCLLRRIEKADFVRLCSLKRRGGVNQKSTIADKLSIDEFCQRGKASWHGLFR